MLWSLLITIKSLIPVIPVNFIVIQGLTLCAIAQFCIQTMRDKSVEFILSMFTTKEKMEYLSPLSALHPFQIKDEKKRYILALDHLHF